jgi:spermidine/putrescine transport system permease protein
MAAVAATTVAHADAVARRRRPSVLAWLVFAPLLGWLIAFVVIPTIMLVLLSLGEQKGLGTFHFTLTFENYARAFHWTWLKVLLVSVWYAVLTTIFCVLIGYPVAFLIAGTRPRTRNVLLTLVMIPFWTSFLIRTYSWITILSKDGLVSAFLVSAKIVPEPVAILYTPFASVLGLVYNYLPFMILPIYASVERLDNAVIEAAYDLGAGPIRAFSQVIIPLTTPGIVAGVLLVFVPSIAMFAITSLMGGGEPPTIGEVTYKQFTSGRNQPFGAALGCLLLLIFFASLWLTRTRREE